ncbi:MAG: MAC/Perforin domain-containing protein [Prevotella sp.]|jgi:hypothetical protein|nr:MAC/Perforin domain-containing protein [Prevotella sp.]
MRKIRLLILISIILFSCSNENYFEGAVENESIESPKLKSYGDGRFDVLGFGYDITDQYLNGGSVRAQVVDVDKLFKQGFITEKDFGNSVDASVYSGSDVLSYSQDISVKLGLGLEFSPFAGSLNSSFKSSYKFDSKKSYASYNIEYLNKSYILSETVTNIRNNLALNFTNHLNTITPEQIVELYGTHVFKGVYTGSRLEVSYETETTSTDQKGSVEAGLAVNLLKLFKLSVDYTYNASLATKNRNSKFHYKTIGGNATFNNSELLDVDGSTVSIPKLDIEKWTNSIATSTSRLVKVDKNFLIPIYELISDPVKRTSVEAYVKQYIKERQPVSVNNYSSAGGVREIPAGLNENQGAGIAIADINKNGIPDVILMAIDNPAKDNYFYYKILFDIDQYGNSNKHSEKYNLGLCGGWESQGGSITVTDLNKNGIPDIIFAVADKSKGGTITSKIAFDVNQSGKSNNISVGSSYGGFGDIYNDIGIDAYDFNKNGIPDVIVSAYDDPAGDNSFRYRIVYDLDSRGICKGGFSQTYHVSGIGHYAEGSGVAVGDIDKNGTPDLLFAMLDAPTGQNKFRYKILWNINSTGSSYATPTSIYPEFTNLDIGWDSQGGDCALYDIDRDGTLDVIFVALDNPKGSNSWRYITGFNFTKTGSIQYWR